MFLNFNDCEISINNTGLMASTASLTSNNGLEPIYALGGKGITSQEHSDGLVNSLNINYVMNTLREPNFETLNLYKAVESEPFLNGLSINVGGISGDFYLKSYSLNISENAIVNVSASYVGFTPLSGDLTAKSKVFRRDEVDMSFDFSNGWTTLVSSKDGYREDVVLSLDYSFSADISPTTFIGQTEPGQIVLLSSSEDFSIEKEGYFGNDVSGIGIEDYLISENREEVKFLGLNALCDSGLLDDISLMSGSFPSLNLSGSEVKTVNISLNVDDVAKVTYKARKYS